MSINNDPFLNEDLKRSIKISIKLLFPNLNKTDSEFLYNYSERLIEKISKYFFFKNEEKYYQQWTQNNYRDIKGVILMLLPFIDDKDKNKLLNEMNDLNQFIYNDTNSLIIPKNLKEKDRMSVIKSHFKFGNMSLGLLNLNEDTPIFINDKKLIYKIIEVNYEGLIKTIQIMNGKYYINWINIIPLEDPLKSELFIKTKEGLESFKNILLNDNDDQIINFNDSYYGLWFGNIYNVIKIKLYDEIKQIKFLIFTFNIKGQSIYLINYLKELFNLELCNQYESYDDLDDIDKSKFETSLKNELINLNYPIWKEILLFLCNNYSKRFVLGSSVDQYFKIFSFTATAEQFDFNDDDRNEDYTKIISEKLSAITDDNILYFLKNIDIKHIWNFFYESLKKFESTYLKDYFKTNSSYYFPGTSTLNFKNIYNIAKSITHYTENTKWLSFDPHYISFTIDKQKIFFNRFLENAHMPLWLNLRNNIMKEYGNIDYNAKINNIYADWNKIKLDLIFNILNKDGVLNSFDVDLNLTDKNKVKKDEFQKNVAKKFNLNAYYYLTNEPFEKLGKIRDEKKKTDITYFKQMEKDQLWYNFYAMDWLAQIGFFKHYIFHRVLYITGATGQGKSTQVPKLLMYALKAYDFKSTGKVVCTQPRIPPTEGNSNRISEELGVPITQISKTDNSRNKTKNFYVQMKHQFNNHLKNNCPHLTLKIVTDGTLYEELKTNPLMKEIVKKNQKDFIYTDKNYYDIVILDESHEHNTNMDMILTLMRQSCMYNNALRLIIVSATMDDDEPIYRSYFRCINDNLIYPIKAPNNMINSIYMDRRYHISPPGETTQYKVTEYYSEDLVLNDITDEEASKIVQKESYKKILEICQKYPVGEILLFSTGQKEIIEAVKELNNILPSGNVALPYYSQLNPIYKDLVEKIDKKISLINNKRDDIYTEWGEEYIEGTGVAGLYKRAIIIATNVAEASITLPTLKFVVDNGYAKVNSYDKDTGITNLGVEKIAEASRVQRRGRIGRVSDGIAFFLFPKGSREKITPKYKITQEDQTKIYLNLCVDENKKSFVIPPPFNPNNKNSLFYKLNIKATKDDDFFTKKVYFILIKQYSINNRIINQNIYWDDTHFPENIVNNPVLYRDYTGQYIKILGDLNGSFYIIHPYENELIRNIYNEIICFRKVKIEAIPDLIFLKDIKELEFNLILINLDFKSEKINDNIVKTELYNKVLSLQKVLGDNSIDTNDCLTLFAATGFNCFNEVLGVLVFIKSFDRIKVFSDEKNFNLLWGGHNLISYYNIYNKLFINFSNLLVFKIIKNPDEINKFDNEIKLLIKNFKIEFKKNTEPSLNNKELWEEMLKLLNAGNLETNKGSQQLKLIIIKKLLVKDILNYTYEINIWCVTNYLNSAGIFIFLEKLGDIVLNVLTIERNLDIDFLEISPLTWISEVKSTFTRVLKTDDLKEKILKSFILGRPLNYAIKTNNMDQFYRLFKPNIRGVLDNYNSLIFYYEYVSNNLDTVKLKIANNIPIDYFTDCLPQIFNKKIFKNIKSIKTQQIINNKFINIDRIVEFKGDNYDRILTYVNNNETSKSPWENPKLGKIYDFLRENRKN